MITGKDMVLVGVVVMLFAAGLLFLAGMFDVGPAAPLDAMRWQCDACGEYYWIMYPKHGLQQDPLYMPYVED